MSVVVFTDGAKGSATQERRNYEHGVHVFASRKDRNSSFVEVWSADRLPGKHFASYRALRDAVERAGL